MGAKETFQFKRSFTPVRSTFRDDSMTRARRRQHQRVPRMLGEQQQISTEEDPLDNSGPAARVEEMGTTLFFSAEDLQIHAQIS